jgi:hypothetical protein
VVRVPALVDLHLDQISSIPLLSSEILSFILPFVSSMTLDSSYRFGRVVTFGYGSVGRLLCRVNKLSLRPKPYMSSTQYKHVCVLSSNRLKFSHVQDKVHNEEYIFNSV